MKSRIWRALCIITVLLYSCLLLAGCSSNQNTKGEELYKVLDISANTDNLMTTINELTSQKYDGRLVGTEGNKLSAQYIADYFKKLGLKSPEGAENYMQYYSQNVWVLNSRPELKLMGSDGKAQKEYQYLKDFTVRTFPRAKLKGEVTAPLYAVESSDQFKNANPDLKGKIVLLPQNVYNELGIRNVVSAAISSFNGIKGVICEDSLNSAGRETNFFMKSVAVPAEMTAGDDNGPIFAFCDYPCFTELVNVAKDNLSVYMNIDSTFNEVKVPNVVGLIPGTDSKLKDEYIIISSHFDHIGDNFNGTYNPGAFDNASGVSVMSEVARVISQNKTGPKKSILFVSFDGEEEGLFGSQYFAAHPLCDLKKTVMINLDMVGARKDTTLLVEGIEGQDAKVRDDLLEYAEKLSIPHSVGKTGRSDHAPLAESGVQAVTLIEMEMSSYHSPNDNALNVDKEHMKRALDLVLYYLSQTAY